MSSPDLYDDSPAQARVPLTPEELDRLLLSDGTFFAGKPARVRHLLTRVRAAYSAHTELVRHLKRDVEQITLTARSEANPVAAAASALRRLTLEEQRQLLDVRAEALIDMVRSAQEDAERVRTAAVNEANRTRFALAKVMDDPQVPADVRQKLADALAELPQTAVPAPAPVEVPDLTEAGFELPSGGERGLESLFGQ